MASLPTPPITEEEYLRIERSAFERSEYHDGEMFAMSGGTVDHSLIAGRMFVLLDRHLSPGCRVFTSDLRVKIGSRDTYLYPDCSVVCGELQLYGDDNVLNPQLIVEVLSPSTEGYDRGKKFELYRTLPSFHEYLLIHSDRRHAEHYSRRPDGGWLLHEYSGPESSIQIASLNLTISLAELYATALNIPADAL